jgi:hypothetical protein
VSRDWSIGLLFPVSEQGDGDGCDSAQSQGDEPSRSTGGVPPPQGESRRIPADFTANSDLLESPCLLAVQEGSADSEWIRPLEERRDSVADGGEDRLEVSAEDEDHTRQFDRIGDENADHYHETVLQLALPRQVCLLC